MSSPAFEQIQKPDTSPSPSTASGGPLFSNLNGTPLAKLRVPAEGDVRPMSSPPFEELKSKDPPKQGEVKIPDSSKLRVKAEGDTKPMSSPLFEGVKLAADAKPREISPPPLSSLRAKAEGDTRPMSSPPFEQVRLAKGAKLPEASPPPLSDLRARPEGDVRPMSSPPFEELKPNPLPKFRELYPPSEAYENGTLPVDSIHTLYYEVHGSKSATEKTALFLHGGPGAGCNPTHARFFNPEKYDTIVLLDQRGCGKSMPRGEVESNTLMHLIGDCESLRKHLNLKQWDVVLGGSWGSTLALAYAQEHPTSVKSMVLRGVCTLRTAEVDWLFTPQGGAAKKCPEAWNAFQGFVGLPNYRQQEPESTTPDRTVLYEYYDHLFGLNSTSRWNAAQAWLMYEAAVSSSFKEGSETARSPAVVVSDSNSDGWEYQDLKCQILPADAGKVDPAIASADLRQGLPHSESADATNIKPLRPIEMTSDDFITAQGEKFGNYSGLPAMPMLTCYYSVNNRYAMNQFDLLGHKRIDRIRHIPCIAVQGGKDPICPPDTALDLNEVWPEMELRIPLLAGHSMYHPEVTHELIQATDRLAML